MDGTYLLIFIISFMLLVRSGGLLVLALTRLARFFGLSEYLVAFLLMSVVTSIPELSIGIAAAVQQVGGLSFGNVVGANILNVTLVVGVAALISGRLYLKGRISRLNIVIVFLLSLLPLLFAVDSTITRIEGAVMLVAFGLYVLRVLGDRAYFSRQLNRMQIRRDTIRASFNSLMSFFGGVALLVISAGMVTYAGSQLALSWGLTNTLFGVIFLGVSTALPELVFSIRAKKLGHADMALGNALGSVAFNAAGIIGLTAIMRPFAITHTAPLTTAMIFFVLIFVLLLSFMYTRNSIGRFEGAFLIASYLAFIITTSFSVWN